MNPKSWKEQYEQWRESFIADVRDACKAFKEADDFPDAWLMLDQESSNWYQENTLFDKPVYRTTASLAHFGHEGAAQAIIPLWLGDAAINESRFAQIRREFEARLAKSGDY